MLISSFTQQIQFFCFQLSKSTCKIDSWGELCHQHMCGTLGLCSISLYYFKFGNKRNNQKCRESTAL